MKINEIRALGTVELVKELDNTYRELFNLRLRLATKQLVNVKEIGRVRNKLARIKTVIRERELSGA
ncbi:MAG: 50S ribosomal protein L29 [Chloroflexi bacterium]|nr:50S ribosomal protein L29 [Chloroflexota bacterium]